MEIVKLSVEWAKAEVFSAKMIGLYSLLILMIALGFNLSGKTPMAKALVLPLVVTGILIGITSAGLYFANKPRIDQFQIEYASNPSSFIEKEVKRTSKSQQDFELVFKILPALIMVAALLIVFLPAPIWHSIGMTTILLMVSLLIIDSNTQARNAAYHQQLLVAKP